MSLLYKKNVFFFIHFFSFIPFVSFCSQKTNDFKYADEQELSVRSGRHRFAWNMMNAELFLDGQIQEGFFYGRYLQTLNHDVPDTQVRFRHRMHAGFYFKQYGSAEAEDTIVEAALKIHNMQWWQDDYSNLLIKYYRITSKISQLSFSDAWIKIKSTLFNRSWNEHLHLLKVGYFPYLLGRGVSLGFADEGGIKYLGYEISYDPIESAYYAPGCLLQGWIVPEKMRYELYGSLMHSEYEPFFLQKEVQHPYLFGRLVDKDACNPYGTFLNRWVASQKLLFFSDKESEWQWRIEQYLLYCNFEYNVDDVQQPLIDRAFHGGTYGCMVDLAWGQWKLNVEAAGNYGTLKFFAYDNNDQLIQLDSSGKAIINYDNAGIKYDDGSVGAMPVTDGLTTVLNQHQGFDTKERIIPDQLGNTFYSLREDQFSSLPDLNNRIGALFIEGNKSALYLIDNDLQNDLVQPIKNIPHPQWRPEKNMTAQGCMFLIDLSYQCKVLPCTFHWAGGYLSGDTAPLFEDDTQFINPDSVSYRGFLPIRDHRYRGLGVKSFSYLTMRTIERPAGNNVHFNDISNLAFAGMGADIVPQEWIKNIVFNTNMVFFFQPNDLYKLDENGQQTTEKASTFAAVEWNASMQYRFLPQCELLVRGAVFAPQRLYRDMKYQYQNFMTVDGVREDVARKGDVSYALHVRMSYDF